MGTQVRAIGRMMVVAAIAFAALPCRGATDRNSIRQDSIQTDSLTMRNDEPMTRPERTVLQLEDIPVVLDSTQMAGIDSLATRIDDLLKPSFRPDPTRALWLALVLPGAGQIYNHKYWKLPIIYGGFLGCAYALTWNNQMLSDYSQAYLDIMDNDPDTKSYEKMLPLNYSIAGREDQFKEIFKNKKDYYRKYRDMSIMAFAAVYALSVIDAYVDAELSSFDISEDLSMRVRPTVITTSRQQASDITRQSGVGMTLSLNF